jgi:hypothetical protein
MPTTESDGATDETAPTEGVVNGLEPDCIDGGAETPEEKQAYEEVEAVD